nr:LacI family DNA-binding transcriptional regulator [Fusobacterium perfoetens]
MKKKELTMITQKEIAEKLGISRTTVARAINGSPSIKKETKEKIMELVRQYNYEKNYIGSSLAIKNKKIIYALVVKSKNEYYTTEINRGLQEAKDEFKAYNIKFKIIQTDINDEKAQLIKLEEILKEKIDGLIITPLAKEKVYKMLKPYIPELKIVSIGIRLNRNISHVGPNHKKMGRIAGEIMKNILRDDEKILIIDNGNDKISSKDYLEGFLSKIKETKLTILGPIKGEGIDNTVSILKKYAKDGELKGIYINRYSHDSLEKVPKELLMNKKIVTNGMEDKIIKLIKNKIVTATIMEEVFLEGYTAGKKIFELLIKNKIVDNNWEILKPRIIFLENLTD